MTEKEYNVAAAKADLAKDESKLKAAKLKFEHGFNAGQAEIAAFVQRKEAEYADLRREVEQAQAALEQGKAYLAWKQKAADEKFE